MRNHLITTLLAIAFLFGCGDHIKHQDSDSRKEHASANERLQISEPLALEEEISEEEGVESGEELEETDKYPDDIYCAEVEYYNHNTETHSSYTLTVQVESHEITEIYWPNGGRSHDDDFPGGELEDDGSASISLDNGLEYEIQIIGKSKNCFINIPKAIQCLGITKKGIRCRNMTDNLNGHCWTHQNQKNLNEPLPKEEEEQEDHDENDFDNE